MIQPQELRIGNLIYQLKETLYGKEILVEVIVTPDIIRDAVNHPDRFEPIPLTKEWLLRFGFMEVDVVNWSIKLGALKLYARTQGRTAYFEIPNSLYFGEIPHVHQLQNLYFSLTGQELTAT